MTSSINEKVYIVDDIVFVFQTWQGFFIIGSYNENLVFFSIAMYNSILKFWLDV